MLKKFNALVTMSLLLNACSNSTVTPVEPDHSATGGDPLPSGTVLIDPNNPTSAPALPPIVGVTTGGTEATHQVVKGDTLYSLARKYQVTVQNLMSWNNLSSPSALKIGQLLKVSLSNSSPSNTTTYTPPASATATYYTVRAGDTLYSLARKYRVTVQNLMSWNQLASPSALKVGQKLRVNP
ncbi:MAG: hypothetical protein RIT27_1715 [Pseudomonadota bacterium]|jgi:LysM repeat protein